MTTIAPQTPGASPSHLRTGGRRATAVAVVAVIALVVSTALGAVYAYRVAFDRAYASTPHSVEHVGVAAAPAATFDDHLHAVLAQLPTTAPTDLSVIQHALRRAGQGDPDGPYGLADEHTRHSLETILRSAPHDDAVASPKDAATYLRSLESGYMASIHELVSPQTRQDTSFRETGPLEASNDLNRYLHPRIGRTATGAEIARFVTYFNEQSAANPETTVTELTPELDEDGLPVYVDGEQQYSDVQRTTSGGIDIEGAVTMFIGDDRALREEAQAYATLGYADAFLCTIQSPLDDC